MRAFLRLFRPDDSATRYKKRWLPKSESSDFTQKQVWFRFLSLFPWCSRKEKREPYSPTYNLHFIGHESLCFLSLIRHGSFPTTTKTYADPWAGNPPCLHGARLLFFGFRLSKVPCKSTMPQILVSKKVCLQNTLGYKDVTNCAHRVGPNIVDRWRGNMVRRSCRLSDVWNNDSWKGSSNYQIAQNERGDTPAFDR